MNFFETHHVTKHFASVIALDNVSISVPKSSIFGLLGPNGAGKTTLIRIINQITAPDSGEILISGKKITAADVRKIGYLPEERGLYKKMKVGEQAMYLAQLKGLSKSDTKQRLAQWFEKFEIMGWWDKKVEELSKGMQQKVQFIITILHEPELLIFDEPFSGFDPINANLLKQEILNLKEKGATILFSTHNMGSVEELCDHIALINKSEKILEGPTVQIREQYKSNEYLVSFKGDAEKVVQELNGRISILDKSTEKDTHTFKLKIGEGMNSNQLLEKIIPLASITSFHEILPSMNDVFIKVVKTNPDLEESL